MPGHVLIRGIDLRLVVAGFVDGRPGIVRNQQLTHALVELEGVDMGFDPTSQLLVREGFGPGVVAGPQHSHEQKGLIRLTGLRIFPRHGLAGPVHKGLLAGPVPLAQGDVQSRLPAVVMLTELSVSVAAWMLDAVFFPQQTQRHVLAPQLLVDPLHIG